MRSCVEPWYNVHRPCIISCIDSTPDPPVPLNTITKPRYEHLTLWQCKQTHYNPKTTVKATECKCSALHRCCPRQKPQTTFECQAPVVAVAVTSSLQHTANEQISSCVAVYEVSNRAGKATAHWVCYSRSVSHLAGSSSSI